MKNEILHNIKKAAEFKKRPDDTPYDGIGSYDVFRIAGRCGIEARFVEITALENDIVPERYIRNIKTLSCRDQVRLLKSTVCVTGLGGLGGVVTEILARTGIGTLIFIDGDIFEENNFNRQLLSTNKLMGKSKVDAAVTRVGKINPSVTVCGYYEYLDEKNANRLVEKSDVVVDCLDNLKTRFVLEKASKDKGLPFVSAAVAGMSGHVTTIFPGDIGLELIYGRKESVPLKGAETVLGCMAPTVTSIAAIESAEVVKILLNKPSVLRNKLFIIDLNDNIVEVLDL